MAFGLKFLRFTVAFASLACSLLSILSAVGAYMCFNDQSVLLVAGGIPLERGHEGLAKMMVGVSTFMAAVSLVFGGILWRWR